MKKMALRILMIISVAFVMSCGSGSAVTPKQAGKATVQNNTASIDGSILEQAKNGAKKLIGKEPIHVSTIEPSLIKNNKVIER